jgi:hypothetical protein
MAVVATMTRGSPQLLGGNFDGSVEVMSIWESRSVNSNESVKNIISQESDRCKRNCVSRRLRQRVWEAAHVRQQSVPLDSIWNTGREEAPNLGYKLPHKEGYFSVPSSDQLQDLRSEIILKMKEIGIPVEGVASRNGI